MKDWMFASIIWLYLTLSLCCIEYRRKWGTRVKWEIRLCWKERKRSVSLFSLNWGIPLVCVPIRQGVRKSNTNSWSPSPPRYSVLEISVFYKICILYLLRFMFLCLLYNLYFISFRVYVFMFYIQSVFYIF
jgi:hypothetical protein